MLDPGELLAQAAKLGRRVGRAAALQVLGQHPALGDERRGGPRGARAALLLLPAGALRAGQRRLEGLQAPAERGQAGAEGRARRGLGLGARPLPGDLPKLLPKLALARRGVPHDALQARRLGLAGPAQQAQAPDPRPLGLGPGPLVADALQVGAHERALGAQAAQGVARVRRAAGAQLGQERRALGARRGQRVLRARRRRPLGRRTGVSGSRAGTARARRRRQARRPPGARWPGAWPGGAPSARPGPRPRARARRRSGRPAGRCGGGRRPRRPTRPRRARGWPAGRCAPPWPPGSRGRSGRSRGGRAPGSRAGGR